MHTCLAFVIRAQTKHASHFSLVCSFDMAFICIGILTPATYDHAAQGWQSGPRCYTPTVAIISVHCKVNQKATAASELAPTNLASAALRVGAGVGAPVLLTGHGELQLKRLGGVVRTRYS